VRDTVTSTVARTFKPLQQFTRGWMMADATDQYGIDLGFRTGKQFWIVGRAGVLGSCPPEVAASALAFHAPEHVHDAWAAIPPGLDPYAVATHYHGRIVEWGDRVVSSFDRERMERLDTLGRRIIDAAPANLGALFAGWRAMPIPDGHGARVALTTHVLREMRGAAHSAAVVAAGITPLDAILASTNAPPRTGPAYAEFMGFTGPFRDPDEVRAARIDAETTTERIMAASYAVLDDAELHEFGDLVETTRDAIEM
jgi:hypothetical protein